VPSIWAMIAFFLLAFVGAYFYYRELAEIAGRRREADQQAFDDDELLVDLRPVTAVAFGRSLPLASGADITAVRGPDGSLRIERLALPLTSSRGLSFERRRAFHTHQILSLAQAFRHRPPSSPGEYRWPDPSWIEECLVAEWPGYLQRLTHVRDLAAKNRALYPAHFVRELPVAVEPPGADPQAEAGTGRRATDVGREDAPVREQQRKKRTAADRGIQIRRVEAEEGESRPWQGEKRDEEAAGADEELPAGGMDLVRSDSPVFRVLRSQSRPAERGGEGSGRFCYDEWDFVQGRYRRRYCQVTAEVPGVPAGPEGGRPFEHLTSKRQVVREVIRLFDALRPIPQRRGRQPDGDAIDIDAFVDESVQMRRGGSVNENVYERHLRTQRSVAVTVLVDLSASTERWVGRRRAFEIGMETVWLFCLGQQALGDDVEVLGFSGTGPRGVRVANFKLFDEAWSDQVLGRLHQARPQAFTRIGAAVRHASASLSRRNTQHKLLLVLSDAEPQDEDGYEGQYGLADTRRALDEARKAGIRPYCLAIDPRLAPKLRHLFQSHFSIHLDPESLPLKLPRIFFHLTQAN